jgi:hypothetical protein
LPAFPASDVRFPKCASLISRSISAWNAGENQLRRSSQVAGNWLDEIPAPPGENDTEAAHRPWSAGHRGSDGPRFLRSPHEPLPRARRRRPGSAVDPAPDHRKAPRHRILLLLPVALASRSEGVREFDPAAENIRYRYGDDHRWCARPRRREFRFVRNSF